MPIPWALVVCFLLGLLLIALIGRLLIVPGRFFWRLLLSGVAGALILAAFNLLSPLTHLSVHVNPFTALAVGFLGILLSCVWIVAGAVLAPVLFVSRTNDQMRQVAAVQYEEQARETMIRPRGIQ